MRAGRGRHQLPNDLLHLCLVDPFPDKDRQITHRGALQQDVIPVAFTRQRSPVRSQQRPPAKPGQSRFVFRVPPFTRSGPQSRRQNSQLVGGPRPVTSTVTSPSTVTSVWVHCSGVRDPPSSTATITS